MTRTPSEHGVTLTTGRARISANQRPDSTGDTSKDTPTPHSSTRACIYCRVSTIEQAQEGLSLSTQETRCRQYAELYGLDVVDVYRDEGASAKNLRRPEATRLFSQLDQYDAIIVLRLDRLTRSVHDFLLHIVPLCDQAGVALHSVTDQFDLSSATGRMVVNILLSVAQGERELIGERIAENLHTIMDNGYHVGPAPYGWKLLEHSGPGNLLQPLPGPYQDAIMRARDLQKAGESLRAIGKDLKRQYGREIAVVHPQAVKRLLRMAPLISEMIQEGKGYRWPAKKP